jgi:hypothetical protein
MSVRLGECLREQCPAQRPECLVNSWDSGTVIAAQSITPKPLGSCAHNKEPAMAKKKAVRKSASKSIPGSTKGKRKKASKRELIDTGRDKRYVRRDDQGQFKESDDMGRSLSQDRRRKSKKVAQPGQGDKGDQKARSKR